MNKKNLIIALIFVGLVFMPVRASERPVDWIIAIVDADVVTFTELVDDMRSSTSQMGYKLDALTPSQMQKLAANALEKKITESIIVQEARRQGITAPPAEIEKETDDALQRIKSQFPTEEAFTKALALEFMTPDRLTEQYRTNAESALLRRKLINNDVRRKIDITDSDVLSAYNLRSTEIRVRHILVSSPIDAEQIKVKLHSGEDFDEVAAEFSTIEAADLGWVRRGKLMKSFEEVAFSLKPGEFSEVVKTRYGFHVMEILDVRTVELEPLTDEYKINIYNELFSSKFDDDMQQYLEDLKGRAYVWIREDYLAPLE